ncbi:MFS transporter [Paraburkholderia edwinii]|uniref:MFS transporter n=1 Tax=Paraburkholderia edwinii TaxID=2861782 RepID=A0ABX8UUH6_9BURK|nr:MFS transporter [Paraburkholderia edwinii]QYD72647.1 MFS transporter [Paraburkholderia edwinii]
MQKGTTATTTRDWLAVISVATAAFVLVTTEVAPIGMLEAIAGSLGVSIGEAGLVVTMPGLMAALAGPLLIVFARDVDRRRMLQALTLAMIVSVVVCACAQQFRMLLAGRLLFGLAVGGFWTFSMSAVRRLVREADAGKALAILSAGIAFGTVLGAPVGSIGARLLGWRAVFLCVALAGFAALTAQLRFVRPLPVERPVGLRDLAAVLKRRDMQIMLTGSALVYGGQFVGYTFLEPYLNSAPNMSGALLTTALLAYGIVGAFSNFVAERITRVSLKWTLIVTIVTLGGSVSVAPVFGTSPVGAVVCATFWGLAWGAWPVSQQIWMYETAPADFEKSAALIVCMAQFAVASGSYVGGYLVDLKGIAAAFEAAGATTALALLFALYSLMRRTLHKRDT